MGDIPHKNLPELKFLIYKSCTMANNFTTLRLRVVPLISCLNLPKSLEQ